MKPQRLQAFRSSRLSIHKPHAWYRKRQIGLLDGALLVVHGDVHAAAHTVEQLLDDPNRREQMGRIGRERMGPPGGASGDRPGSRAPVQLSKLMPAALAIPYAVLPLFPSFITLTAVTVPGVSLLSNGVTIALIACMAVLSVYALIMVLRPPRQRPPTLVTLLVWIGAAFLSALLGFDPSAGIVFIGILGMGLLWHLALLRYYTQPGVSRAIFWSYLLSGGLASLAAIVMVLARRPAMQYAIAHGRAIGTFILPGELAGYLIVFLPIAFVVARTARDPRMRVTAWCALGVGRDSVYPHVFSNRMDGIGRRDRILRLFRRQRAPPVRAAHSAGGFGRSALGF